MNNRLTCRFCTEPLDDTFVNLGDSPLANGYVTEANLDKADIYYPLHVRICRKCLLVQLPTLEKPEDIFTNYAYFSSFSSFWLKHCKKYADFITKYAHLTKNSKVIEIASNDGYLLKFFKQKDIPILGIEPARNIADVAISEGIPTIAKFFGTMLATSLKEKGEQADLLIANNVLAHVPDINDFVNGMKILLAKEGLLTVEFPHILNLINNCQFDTIYHEHFSYFSIHTASTIFKTHGLWLFDAEEIPTHGGSLRLYIRHMKTDPKENIQSSRLEALIRNEISAGLNKFETYTTFTNKVSSLKKDCTDNLMSLKNNGASIAAYGAPAKGNTLLNYCGINKDIIDYTVDKNPLKQNHWLPGSRIRVFSPDHIMETKPDYLIILPWNIKDEIMKEASYIRTWGGKFIIPIPEFKII